MASESAASQPRSNSWQTALTVVQEVEPPFIPQGAHAMTVVIEYGPGDPGAPPHRHPGGPAFGYVLEGEMLFELEGEAPRVVKAGEPSGNLAATSSTTGRKRPRRRQGPLSRDHAVHPGQPMLIVVEDDELEARRDRRVLAETH